MRRALPAGRSTSLPAGNREMGRLLGPFPWSLVLSFSCRDCFGSR